MDVAAHDLTRTIDCQVVGCDQAAEPGALVCHRHESVNSSAPKRCRLCAEDVTGDYSRGPLANLCADHQQIRRDAMSGRRESSPRQAEPVVPSGASFAAQVKTLVPLAKKLDSAIAQQERGKKKIRQQRNQLEQRERVADQDVAAAFSEWRRALQALAG